MLADPQADAGLIAPMRSAALWFATRTSACAAINIAMLVPLKATPVIVVSVSLQSGSKFRICGRPWRRQRTIATRKRQDTLCLTNRGRDEK